LITVFPAASSNAQEKRLVTEYNICNIVNRLVDKKSFVISANAKSNPTVIEFNISGYFFRCNNVKVDILDQITDEMKEKWSTEGGPDFNPTGSDDGSYRVYAWLTKNTTAKTDDWSYLDVKNGTEYTEAEQNGLVFGTIPAKDSDYLYILFHDEGKDTGTGIVSNYVPAESWIRFNQNSIFIDDGDLDSAQS